MIKIAPSLLSADFGRLAEQVRAVEEAGADYLHLDIMDGRFVPKISFGSAIMAALRPGSKLFFDVHLMVEEPDRFIPDFVRGGADLVTVHAEACRHLDRSLRLIRQSGARVGVALNPATSLEVLRYVLEEVDLVLLMSVNPGFGGQEFIPFVVQKTRELKELVRKRNLDLEIEVDGGITAENVPPVVKAGAEVLVAGTSVFGSPDLVRALTMLRQAANAQILKR